MPGEECRGLAQHRPPSSVVLHCRRRSDVCPNVSLPLSDTCWRARHRRRPRFPWGTKHRGTTKSFPWGTKTRGLKEELHPLASAASSTPPQIPLGGETPRKNPLASAESSTPPQLPLGDETPGTKEAPAGERGNIDATPASLGEQNPEERRRASLGGRNPGDKFKEELLLGDENLRTKGELPLGDETLGTTTTTPPNLQGCGHKKTKRQRL